MARGDLQSSILESRAILGDAGLRNAFGARDMWQVIDRVNVDYLGGARNTQRYRTQSRAGAVIIGWIAKSMPLLANAGVETVNIDQIGNPQARAAGSGENPMRTPTDWDLVNACEQWLAAGGMQEQGLGQYSSPS